MPARPVTSISLAHARVIVDAALEYAHGNSFPPMTIAVLDAAGQLVAFAREDGSSLLRERIARGKAHGALNLGVGSRSLAAVAVARPAFVDSLIALADGNLVPGPGGVLVHDEHDRLIGAVGVSGHLPDDDEASAIHGITAAGLRADPGV
jgi:uncharacterized protein GlcG (DUF336 family)